MKKILRHLFLPLIFIAAGCVPAEYVFNELPPDPSSPVVVAALLPLSGESRVFGEQMKEGLLMAENTVNNRGGVSGRTLKLEIIDTNSGGTAAAVQQAVSIGARGIIAGHSTREVTEIIAAARHTRIPIVIPLATADEHLQMTPFVYRNCFSDTQQMEVLAAYLRYWRVLSKGAVITDPAGDAEYATNISMKFTQALKDAGGTMLYSVALDDNAVNSDRKIRSILETDPDFIMLASRGKKTAELIKKLRGYGFSGILCGADCWDDEAFFAELKGTNPGECVFTSFFSKDNQSPEFKIFRDGFRKKYFHLPSACETQSYDALLFLAIGLNNAGNLFEFDRNWRTIRKFQGAAAMYTMLPKGGIDRTVYLKSFKVDHAGGTPEVSVRLTKSLQYSKLKDYRVIE